MTTAMTDRKSPLISQPARLLFFFLLALYLLTWSADFHSSDGLAMFSTAESLARRGAWDIEQIRWMGLQQGAFGQDGLLYSRKGLGQPLLALPLTWLGLVLPGFGPAGATLLFGSLLTALTGAMIFAFGRQLGYRASTAMLSGLIFGTGTMAWPYAKTFFSDTLAGALLLATTMSLFAFRRFHHTRYAFFAGLALAWAVATRYAEGVFLPVFGLLFLACLWQAFPARAFSARLQAALPAALAFTAPVAVIGLGLLTFNLSRYGNPLDTGYLPEETFSAVWWQGIAGQLISPGRGLLLYNPILVVALWGAVPLFKKDKLTGLAAPAVILIHLLLYGKWFMWHGGFAWGARFMVATLPFWAIWLAPVLEKVFGKGRRLWRWGLPAVWGLSVIAQIPGLAVDFDLWQNRLLETGLPLFDPLTFFRPVYSPLLQTWPLINIQNLDVAWAVNGRVAWSMVIVLITNIFIAGWGLLVWKRARARIPAPLTLVGVSGLLTAVLLLRYAHTLPPADLQAALRAVNRLPDAPLIYNQPTQAAAIAELYAGRGPVLGLGRLETGRLDAVAGSAEAVWWLSPWQGDIERYLQQTHGQALSQTRGAQRVTLFARADGRVRAVGAAFDDGITLQSVRLSPALKPNAPFAVSFTWRAKTSPAADYRIFVHLLNATGAIVAQTDGAPVHWTRPTSTWRPDEPIVDHHALWIPDLPQSKYRLVAGLYEPSTGARLSLSTGGDFVLLQTFRPGD